MTSSGRPGRRPDHLGRAADDVVALLLEGRDVGQERGTLRVHDAERPEPVLVERRLAVRHAADLDMPAHQRCARGGAIAEGDDIEVEARELREAQRHQMVIAADAADAQRHRAVLLAVGDEIVEVLDLALVRHAQRDPRADHVADVVEAVDRPGRVLGDGAGRHVRHVEIADRIAVGRRLRELREAELAARPGLVDDHDVLAQALLEIGLVGARTHVAAAAGRERDEQRHRPLGILGQRRRRSSQRDHGRAEERR